MVDLVLGPLLRHVGESDASIWVETSASCEVEVRAGSVSHQERTFSVAGHHYAVVVLTGLEPASATPYEVRIDGETVWPPAHSPFPPSLIRTVDSSRPIRLMFGSCRTAPGAHRPLARARGLDVLHAFAARMLTQQHEDWPELLVFVGDQVYADETSKALQEFIRQRRDIRRPPKKEVADFEEYTRLYLDTWSEPPTRWLLSTMPTSMIFDDHDVRDDWNTSHAWRLDIQKTSWWQERITGALMSYWIYQHLGNLSPEALAGDETYRAVRNATDGAAILRAFAEAADREADGAKGAMWSYRRDFGPVRLLVIDSRCGRVLADGRRSMVSDAEFDWIGQQTEPHDRPYDHLVVVTSVPWLLPRALHDLESWDEALASGSRGRILAPLAEWLRRAVDLEHWAAFRESFDRLAELFAGVGRGGAATKAPATVCVLSGDVHHTYLAEAEYPRPLETRVYQVTCSPMNNSLRAVMRVVFRVGWSRRAERLLLRLTRITRVPPVPIRWHHPSGPHFGNMLAVLTFDGRSARVRLERAIRADPADARGRHGQHGLADLEVVDDLSLTEPRRRRR